MERIMKKTLLISIIVLTIAITACFAFAGCTNPINAEIKDGINYSLILKDYLAYPDAANVASMEAIERNVTDIYNDSSLSMNDKIAQMVERATLNEIDCEYFAFFNGKVGSTNLNSNSGTLIYQRLRRQSDTVKDDTTIKLPVNHNFDVIASTFVTAADIRYVTENNKYFRMDTANSKIKYNEESGLLYVDDSDWKKESNANWNKDQTALESRSYDEVRKSVINWNAEGIVADGGTINIKEDENGNKYYELTFSINVDVANADATTIERLENDNGGSDMKIEKCEFVVQIWECGLAKQYNITEVWSGTIVAYSGSAQSTSEIIFSYSENDMDYSKTQSILQGLL